ncbi:salicylate synthase [Aliamphritea hakodatensis]|uniref:salicylate synthase n=1 Tax=Aliamphritea hakodatensis TaxID=2895352 RepID=UPI0022FD8E82|nr:salicylate synthase [Aliamphritea hakodatensis]
MDIFSPTQSGPQSLMIPPAYESMTLGALPQIWAEHFVHRTALQDAEGSMSYVQFSRQIEEQAAGFSALGLQPGDNVLLHMHNSSRFVVTCFALFRIGAVPVLTLPSQRRKDLLGLADIARPKVFIATVTETGQAEFEDTAAALLAQDNDGLQVIADGVHSCYVSLADLPVRCPPPSVKVTDEEMALLLISGGTTGTPKLIPRTHRDYLYNVTASASLCGVNSDSVYLAVLPAAHNFTFGCPGILGTLAAGGKVVFPDHPGCDETMPLISRYRVTHTALVPTLAQLWTEARSWEDSDLSSLVMIQIGGARLDPLLAQKVETSLGPLQQVFGMAEGLLCYTRPDDPLDVRVNCQGRPLSADDEVLIVDDQLQPVAPGETGELLTRGPYTIKGYYHAEAHNKLAFTEQGYYRTGDLVRLTTEGNLQVMGRKKEQINRNGEKISAAEVEDALQQLPDISGAVVVPVPDKNYGERICAFVIWESEAVTASAVRQQLVSEGLSQYKIPDQIESVGNWPLTAVGKIDKQALIRRAETSSDNFDERRCYETFCLEHDSDPATLAVCLSEDIHCQDFIIYEQAGEWSIGINRAASLTVNTRGEMCDFSGQKHQLSAGEICTAIDAQTAAINIADWRLYGRADFEFCRFALDLPQEEAERTLVDMFVPETEIRISKTEIRVRTLQPSAMPDVASARLLAAQRTISAGSPCLLSQQDILQQAATRQHYKSAVSNSVADIQRDDYQKVILSRRACLPWLIDFGRSYLDGRRHNTPARSFSLRMGDFQAFGFSPETVLEVDHKGLLSTQPLAGTRALPDDPCEAAELTRELLRDPKEITEHAISVKLAVEELEQVCAPGTTGVSEFMSVYKRGSVQHLASRVTGQLRDDRSVWDAFKVIFPAITASGIPKRESIAAIMEYEEEPRGLYSGCVLVADCSGSFDAALVLRSAYGNSEGHWLQAGAGVVSLSTPEREWEETCEKMACVLNNVWPA